MGRLNSVTDDTERLGAMLVFSVIYIMAFIGMVALIPPEFFIASQSYNSFNIPDFWTPTDVQTVRHYLNKTIESQTVFDFNTAENPANFKFRIIWFSVPYKYFDVRHITWTLWGFLETTDTQVISAPANTTETTSRMTKEYALGAWHSALNASVFTFRCDHIKEKAWLFDSNTTRNDLAVAWDDNELALGIGFGYEDYELRISMWEIIGNLLMFQAPVVFDFSGTIATFLNGIIATPFYISFAYLAYRLIIKIIPFVAG